MAGKGPENREVQLTDTALGLETAADDPRPTSAGPALRPGVGANAVDALRPGAAPAESMSRVAAKQCGKSAMLGISARRLPAKKVYAPSSNQSEDRARGIIVSIRPKIRRPGAWTGVRGAVPAARRKRRWAISAGILHDAKWAGPARGEAVACPTATGMPTRASPWRMGRRVQLTSG